MLRFSVGDSAVQVPIIQPAELHTEISSGTDLFLLDVREPHELAISALDGALNIPLGELPFRMVDVPADRNVVVICRSGARSAQAAALLIENGYPRVRNLATGMNGWARQVDPTVQTY